MKNSKENDSKTHKPQGFTTHIILEGKVYRVFFDWILEDVFISESFGYIKNIPVFKNPTVNIEVKKKILGEILNLPPDEQFVTLRSAFSALKKNREERLSKAKTSKKTRGRPNKPYLREATLWVIKNQETGEQRRQVIKRAYEKYKNESPNLKSFSTSVTNIWNETRDKWREWKQKDVAKNTIPLKTFAEKYLKASFKVNKNRHKKKFAEIK